MSGARRTGSISAGPEVTLLRRVHESPLSLRTHRGKPQTSETYGSALTGVILERRAALSLFADQWSRSPR